MPVGFCGTTGIQSESRYRVRRACRLILMRSSPARASGGSVTTSCRMPVRSTCVLRPWFSTMSGASAGAVWCYDTRKRWKASSEFMTRPRNRLPGAVLRRWGRGSGPARLVECGRILHKTRERCHYSQIVSMSEGRGMKKVQAVSAGAAAPGSRRRWQRGRCAGLERRRHGPKNTTNSAAATHLNTSFAMVPPHIVEAVMITNMLPCFRVGVMIRHHGLADHDERHGHNDRKCYNLEHGLPPFICTRDGRWQLEPFLGWNANSYDISSTIKEI